MASISNISDARNMNGYFRCGAGNQDVIKFMIGVSAISTVLPFNGVSPLQMSYLATTISNVQNQINNCVHFTDLSYNNNLIFVSNMSYVNGIYNTLSSYIPTTNNHFNNYQTYNY